MALTLVGRPRRVVWSGPPSAAVISVVRREAREVLAQWKLTVEVIEDAVLVIAELLINVVQHARTGFRLVVELRGHVLCVAVEDGLCGPAPAGAGAVRPGHVGGLRLVNRVAVRWGWQQHEAGKTVWAELMA